MSPETAAHVAELLAAAPPLDDSTREEAARLLSGARSASTDPSPTDGLRIGESHREAS